MRISSVHIPADRNCSLLTVQNLIAAVFPYHPVHRIQRKPVRQSIQHRLLLIIVIAEFPLIRRTDIQLTAKPDNSRLVIILISVNQVSNFNCVQCNFHLISPLGAPFTAFRSGFTGSAAAASCRKLRLRQLAFGAFQSLARVSSHAGLFFTLN